MDKCETVWEPDSLITNENQTEAKAPTRWPACIIIINYYYYQCTDLSDAVTRTMQGHFTESNNSEEGSEKVNQNWAINRCVLSCCRREVKDETVRMAFTNKTACEAKRISRIITMTLVKYIEIQG